MSESVVTTHRSIRFAPVLNDCIEDIAILVVHPTIFRVRSMLDTPQRYPYGGSQSFPSPAAVATADGVTTVYFGPTLLSERSRSRQLDTDDARQEIFVIRTPLKPRLSHSSRKSGGRAKSNCPPLGRNCHSRFRLLTAGTKFSRRLASSKGLQ